MTVVPETSRQELNHRRTSVVDDDIRRNIVRPADNGDGDAKSPDDEHDVRLLQIPANRTPSNIPIGKPPDGILGNRRDDPDDRLLPKQQQSTNNDHNNSPTLSDNSDAGPVKPANVTLQYFTASETGADAQPQNE